jgi:multidrug efflux pump subunit AcrB
MIRSRVQDLPGIEKLEFQSSPIGEEPDVEIELSHPEEKILNSAAEELKSIIAKIEGTKEVADSFEEGKEEFVFELNEKGLSIGLTPAIIGQQLRSAFFGLEAQRFQRGSNEVIAYVRYPKKERESIETLQNARIRLLDGKEVPLKDVANVKIQTGYSAIKTVDGKRIVSVTADVDYKIATPNDIIAKIQSDILPKILTKYSGLTASFEGESKEQKKDLKNIGNNMLIALLLIFILLGSQLRSYIQPIIIMSAIPFGIVGAVLGHFLLGQDFTFISLFGIVALMGVVVNDSVVLMDFLNRKVDEGESVFNAAILAIKRRFRPILLTSLTTSLGLFPMLLETSLQARFLIPMVISLAAGIIFATVIILLLVPSLVLIAEDIKSFFSKKFGKYFN